MNSLIKLAIERPVAVMAVMILTVMFGVVSSQIIPIQMSPDIEKPILQVRINWSGASPEDVDREIVSRLETELSGLNGVEDINSRSDTGRARVTLTYSVGTDMDKALTMLLSELSGITDLPDEASAPSVRTSNSDDSPIARLALTANEQSDVDVEQLGNFLEDGIVAPLERVSGVAEISLYGGGRREMRVEVNPADLIRYNLGLPQVLQALRQASATLSVGTIERGKRTYTVRTQANLFTPQTAGQIVIRNDLNARGQLIPVLLSDIAEIKLVSKKRTSFRRLNGKDAVILNALREQDSNVVETMENLRLVIDEMNEDVLKSRGLNLRVVYDETDYIASAIDLVKQNIWVGGLLALTILVLFLRAFAPTFIIFMAIPTSVIGTFVAMAALGMSINVISLAGLAFAVGMVVDASIVSQENIYRLRQNGIAAPQAAFHGARQVWAPILGSALTTVVVFIPVVMLKLPVGQLFRDIGVAISVSVLISVLVSTTLIPSLSALLLRSEKPLRKKSWQIPLLDSAARQFKNAIMAYARMAIRRRMLGAALVVAMIITAGISTWRFMPQLDYLPDGNANFVFGSISVPPGYSMEETKRIAARMEEGARPLWEGKVSADGPPEISRFFFVAFAGGAFAGASSLDPGRINELRDVLSRPVFAEPGARAFVRQASLFGRSVGGSRSISLDVTGPTQENIGTVTTALNDALAQAFPRNEGNQIRVLPSLNTGTPQIQLTPDPVALAASGLSMQSFAQAVDIYNDGMRVTQIPIDGELIDLTLAGQNAGNLSISDLENLPIITPSGEVVSAGQLARVSFVSAPEQIRRIGGNQARSLQLRPDESLPLESAIQKIETEILPQIAPLAAEKNVQVNVRGAAGELARTWAAMQTNVLAAIAVIFLLMVVLLRSFTLPAIILLVIPMASAGGIAGLAILNLFIRQSLDMLTMLGFVILTGVVVNNAILMIEQTSLHIREDGMSVDEAILEATSNRIRPIFMSTLTSLFGLVPLVVFPGAGSELYRGIGTVVFGGLALSTLATLLMIPPLLSLARKQLEAASRPAVIDLNS